jgi:Dyp-type peroxidase family
VKPRQPAPRRALDLADIQGNILRPYGRFGFPITRHVFFTIIEARAGRHFVERVRHHVTTAQRWATMDGEPDANAPQRPQICVNIGFSFAGLLALKLPTRTLSAMPEEFIDGMARRASILGDIGKSAPAHWDKAWQTPDAADDFAFRQVHVWVSLAAQAKTDGTPVDDLAERTSWLLSAAQAASGVSLVTGHAGPSALYQDATAIMAELPDGTVVPTATEHFGFMDGIGDPTFDGQYEPVLEASEVIGAGKLRAGKAGWAPLATGEFILGHPGEAQELPPTAPPWSFMRNGTFTAFRKLHQNTASFDRYVDEQADLFQRLGGPADRVAARETIMAKMVGRWRSGFPLSAAPDWAEAVALAEAWSDIPAIRRKASSRDEEEAKRLTAYETLLADFRYKGDTEGTTCPVGCHIRRTNPRDALDPGFGTPGAVPDSALTNRRRILRRGAPYGDTTNRADDAEHGVIFMAVCASLFRQFEFVQQQWVHYGASFNLGNDTDPIAGLRREGAKFVITTDGARGESPFICANMPLFVETRGGEYFFLPSLTALREIAEGSVDPT